MNITFENKVALVTGAASGLGLATAQASAEASTHLIRCKHYSCGFSLSNDCWNVSRTLWLELDIFRFADIHVRPSPEGFGKGRNLPLGLKLVAPGALHRFAEQR
jgi:hypothetical protein